MKALLLSLLFAASAHADCLPEDAGGYGKEFRMTASAEGIIYSWHCPASDGGWTGQWLAVHADWSSVDPVVQGEWPKWPSDRVGRINEIARLQRIHKGAVDSRTFLAIQAKGVLEESRPSSPP